MAKLPGEGEGCLVGCAEVRGQKAQPSTTSATWSRTGRTGDGGRRTGDVDLKQLAQPINGNKARRGDSMRRLIKTLLHGGKEFSNQSALACGKIGKIRQLANGRWEMGEESRDGNFHVHCR